MHSITPSNKRMWQQIPNLSGKTVLDLSCGWGSTTVMLTSLGLRVTCTNYDPVRPKGIPEQATFIGGVDLSGPWPVEDESFDFVNMQEIIEHLQNVTHTLSQISRILKPGGQVVLSTPNILNLRSRLHFLFTGFYEGRRHPIGYSKGLGNAGNVYMTNLPQLHYLMAHLGLSIRELGVYRVALLSRVLYVTMFPFIFFFTWRVTRRPRKNWMMDYGPRRQADPEVLGALVKKQRPVSARLRKLMLSRPVLLSRNLIVRAQKTGLGPFEA